MRQSGAVHLISSVSRKTPFLGLSHQLACDYPIDAPNKLQLEANCMTHDGQPNWNQIVDRHGRRVFRIALRVLGSIHDAEDVSQEVFAEAYRIQQTDSVHSWPGLLVRLATRRAIDRLRRNRPAKELRDDDHVSTVEPFEEATAKELAHWLRTAIARLPDQQATVFAMIYFEQLSRDQVATNLEISPEAVSTALYKARQRLMSQLSVLNGRESQ